MLSFKGVGPHAERRARCSGAAWCRECVALGAAPYPLSRGWRGAV